MRDGSWYYYSVKPNGSASNPEVSIHSELYLDICLIRFGRYFHSRLMLSLTNFSSSAISDVWYLSTDFLYFAQPAWRFNLFEIIFKESKSKGSLPRGSSLVTLFLTHPADVLRYIWYCNTTLWHIIWTHVCKVFIYQQLYLDSNNLWI